MRIGNRTMSTDATLFAVAPHMHQLGIYEKVVAESSLDGEVVMFDGPYDFDDQFFYCIDEFSFAQTPPVSGI